MSRPDEPNDTDLPEVVLAEPSPSRRPGFGITQAILWCLAFLLVQTIAFAAAMTIVLAVHLADEPNAQAWLDRLPRELERGRIPDALGAALRWGFFVAEATAVLFAVLLLRGKFGRGWSEMVELRRPTFEHLLMALLLLPGLMFLHGGLHELLQSLVPTLAEQQQWDVNGILKQILQPWPSWLMVLTIGLGPGLCEELFCRGFLARGLTLRYGLIAGVILTSILFGALHVAPLYAVATGCMGLMLHLSYLATRSLWVPILLHALNNALTALATVGTIPLDALEQQPGRIAWQIYASSAMLALACGYGLWATQVRDGEGAVNRRLIWGKILCATGLFAWVVMREIA